MNPRKTKPEREGDAKLRRAWELSRANDCKEREARVLQVIAETCARTDEVDHG